MTRGPDWNVDENRLIVAEYFDMLSQEIRGEDYNKTERNRRLQELMPRSRGSIEFKHQNISAVLYRHGLPIIDGYKPRQNTQGSLEEAVLEFLKVHPEINQLLGTRADEAPRDGRWSDLATPDRWVPAPPPIVRDDADWAPTSGMYAIDYAARERRNQRLGEMGEEFAYWVEKRRLEGAGRPDLARQVEWTSKHMGDGLGFDIRSFEPEGGREVWIEVKATNAGIFTPFFVSRNEVATSTTSEATYRLFRLFHFDRNPRFFTRDGALERTFRLSPQTFLAKL